MAYQQPDVPAKRVSSHGNRMQEQYKLYVENLPQELNEDGVRQIFNEYGKILGLFYRKTFAYVSYGTYQEAEHALRDLNDKRPLCLRISLAKETPQRVWQSNETERYNEVHKECPQESRYDNVVHTKTIGRGKPIKEQYEKLGESQLPVHKYTSDDDVLYPAPCNPLIYNPFDNPEPYISTNHLWTRGTITMRGGKRHISCGRGYTLYEIPNPHPKLEDGINRVYEKRRAGIYQYGEDLLQQVIGKCQKCSKKTKHKCQRCYGFYCSRECQVDDWPRHKVECQTIPGLIKAVDTTSLSESSSDEHIPVTNSAASTRPTLRRPRTAIGTAQSKPYHSNKDKTTEHISSQNMTNQTNAQKEELPELNQTNNVVNNCIPQENIVQCKDSRNGPQFRLNASKEGKLEKHHQHQHLNNEKQNMRTQNMPRKKDTPFKQNSNNIAEEPSFRRSSCSSNKSQQFNQHQKVVKTSNVQDAKDLQNTNGQHGSKQEDATKSNDVKEIEKTLAFQKDTFLPQHKFTDVQIVVSEGNGEYWIQKKEDIGALTDMMIQLQNDAKSSPQIKDPLLGHMYAVEFEGIWHRAVVTNLNPLKVHYIDYGNEEDVTTHNFREISKFNNIPKFARKIRLPQDAVNTYKNLESGTELSVKMIFTDPYKVINVLLQNESKEVKAQSTSSNSLHVNNVPEKPASPRSDTKVLTEKTVKHAPNELPSIIDSLSVGVNGYLQIYANLSANVYGVTILVEHLSDKFEIIYRELPEECEKTQTCSDFKPQVGDLICGQREDGDWLRGYIVTLNPLQLAVVDETRISPVHKMVPYPQKFLNICTFGAVCEVINTRQKLDSRTHYSFQVTDCQNGIHVKLSSEGNNEEFTAIIKPWKPVPEQKGIPFAELKSGSEVCITAYRSPHLLFVRSLDTEELEYYHRMIQNVAKCAQSAPHLKEFPVVGQMVLARFSDNNHYRAIVTKIVDEKIAISYVDYGNVEITSLDKLKELSDDLKALRSCTAKIVLKDMPKDIPMNQDTSYYLAQLVGTEVPLKCIFDGIPSKDGVTLKFATGENVSDKIRKMLQPSWKSNEDDKTCYMITELGIAGLGVVGEVTNAYVLYVREEGKNYIMCPFDPDLMTHICDIMPKSMNEYCNTTDYYIPRDHELCLALYNNEWYRAVCLNRNTTSTSATVFFVDYGNTEIVDHKDIRLMTKDFMTPVALGNLCIVLDMKPVHEKDSKKVLQIISELTQANTCVKIKILSYDSKYGEYKIDLPEVREKLVAEHLISE